MNLMCGVRVGVGLLWILPFVLCTAPTASQSIPLRRVPTYELRIPLPGVAVIRDSATWKRLWLRYEERAYGDSGVVHAAIPAADFRTEMLVAVSLGPSSGCSNSAQNIGQIVERPDSIVVVIGSAGGGEPQLTCAMIIEPVDVVRLRRSAKPVAFHSYEPGNPTPSMATWWSQPSPAELDRMDEVERSVITAALVRDPATPLSTLVTIVGRLRVEDGEIVNDLLRRPDVLASTELLIALARLDEHGGSDAENVLVARHGLALAGDPATPRDVLRMLIEHLRGSWTPRHQELARLLVQNPTVQGTEELLDQFIFLAQNRHDVTGEACKVYEARWRSKDDSVSDNTSTIHYVCSQLLHPEPPGPRSRH